MIAQGDQFDAMNLPTNPRERAKAIGDIFAKVAMETRQDGRTTIRALVDGLVEEAMSPAPDLARVKAIEAALNRLAGKPRETVDVASNGATINILAMLQQGRVSRLAGLLNHAATDQDSEKPD